MYGRRRVGKSWLLRRLAHGKPAVILVADRVAPGQQLDRLARQLERPLGVVPRIEDVADLVRVLYRLARQDKTLVVLDEFPYLLGTTAAEQQSNLSAIQAVLEQERDDSRIKLVLTGSTISTMQELQAERSPLHGRVVPFPVRPLRFAHARRLMDAADGADSLSQLTRYSVTGGMPRYLAALRGADLAARIANQVVDPGGGLFNEPRTLLQSELREPAVYFSILNTLAVRPRQASEIGAELKMATAELSIYLSTLASLQIVSRHLPVGAARTSRSTQWRCDDDFIRFWFRFVQPYQGELEAGGDPGGHVEAVVLPHLADHAELTFERTVQDWMRHKLAGQVLEVGSWWGPALHPLRARKERFSEEIDAVGIHHKNVIAVAEAKWTNKPMNASVLTDLRTFKLPALAQAGLTAADPRIILASRGGFTPALTELASAAPDVELITATDLLDELT
jgi:AAA+ ATPase superfamily predicted ATPase